MGKPSPLDLATSATSALSLDDIETQTSPNVDSKSQYSGKEHVDTYMSLPSSTAGICC